MLLFPNATVTISRRATTPDANGSYTMQVVKAGVSCLMQPGKGRVMQDVRLAPGGQAEEFDWSAIFDAGTDVRERDQITGWNPQNLADPPVLVVRRVFPIVGLLPHVEVYLKDNRP